MDPTVLQQTPLQPSPGIGDGSKSERTPLALRVFGALLMAGGVAVVPEVIHTLAQMGTVFVEKTYTDDSLLTIILYVTLALSAWLLRPGLRRSRLPPSARQPPARPPHRRGRGHRARRAPSPPICCCSA